MGRNLKIIKSIALLLAIITSLLFTTGCRVAVNEKDLVGKWKSSKLATPVYLHANGEWEIKKDDGAVLQYGVWKVKGKNIIWSYKIDSHVGHEGDPILSSSAKQFQVRESDGTITTFTKLD